MSHTDLELDLTQLFAARKVLTDGLVKTSTGYRLFYKVEVFTNEQVDKIDKLIRDLTGITKEES